MNSGALEPLCLQEAPAARRAAALALVLRDASPEVRSGLMTSENAATGVWTALRGDRLVGAIWFTVHPGRTAAIWPPKLVDGEPPETAQALLKSAAEQLDRLSIELVQALLSDSIGADAEQLRRGGFTHLTDLLYLFSATSHTTIAPPSGELEFEPVGEDRFERLQAIVERTYEGTCDCPSLNGVRTMSDVIAGYLATGDSRTELWRYVRHAGRDVGCLLLADHRTSGNLELVYMGLIPEARGRRWGAEIVRQAQDMTRDARCASLLLAVDAANTPALNMYLDAGLTQWERRSVFVHVGRTQSVQSSVS